MADSGNNKVRKIDSRGYVSTVAGSGLIGITDGVGTSVALYSPRGVAIDMQGYLYVSEFMSNRIQVIYLEAPTIAACDNSWHHVALTYGDGAPDAYKAYLDGAFVDEGALPQTIPANPTLYVGWNGNSSVNGGEMFTGSIADLRVFPRSLEAWEVSDLAHPYFPFIANSVVPLYAPATASFTWQCSPGFYGAAAALVSHNALTGVWTLPSTIPATRCTACAATFYSYAGSAACAQCSLSVSTFASPTLPCQPLRFSALNSALVFYHSGDSAEGLGPFTVTTSPVFVADRLGFASSAMSFSGPSSYLSLKPNAIAKLPAGNAPASVAFWVNCPPTASPVSAVEWGVPVDASAQRFAAMLGSNTGTAAAPAPAPAQVIATTIVAVAGANGVKGSVDGVATNANFFGGYATSALNAGLASFSTDGAFLYFADTGNHKIRRFEVATGKVVTIAGGGASGVSGGPGTWIEGPGATTALFNSPRGVVADPKSGKIYVSSVHERERISHTHASASAHPSRACLCVRVLACACWSLTRP